MNQDASYFFCGIGGSGMLPLALIVQAQGHAIEGSDRALDQGRTPEKFDWLRAHGVTLHPQDGSGVTRAAQTVVATGAIEDTVPDIGAARRVGAVIKTRPQLLSQLFNAAPTSVGVAGTSGKSTITGMIAWILSQAERNPTVVNGAVMKNFADADHPFASALVGGPDLFVAEVDESDGSIAGYDPTVAVVSNISLDHKSMEELRDLFGGFTGRAATAVLNLDNPETAALVQTLPAGKAITFALGEEKADLSAYDLQPMPTGMKFRLMEGWSEYDVVLNVPGAHNVANALAALGAVKALDVPTGQAVKALETFAGIRRRMEVVGTVNDITVIDDFAHNPDKIAATLKTLHAFDGRLLILFQPHGFGPLKLMKSEFIDGFAGLMRETDVLLMPEPVYYGGTTDRSVGSEDIASGVRAAGRQAEALPTRADCGDRIIEIAQPGDRIIVMGARDDTLSSFAVDLLGRLDQSAG
ncbi:MAG: UDP-N-acetylmuramate--alanine ligase [Alphaproteobacteria bacterium]|uniref:UDP-N-acetylmuramate--L-alanine ligase n=1 Tax=Brevundimonas sp. TaxID=1871086 RepID=UPI001DCF5FB6|nr:UDP-N-acetylmuramate--alanine ligase [Alphaproteobacteria bacterium]MBU1520179.1 UDP-N-acetylmuramate--alanine ligase [Alphaproteobacteria bacterium]MBU2029225.1 UDP-N-acetylmuramate--alanine ligase [Alphaproteobacteria bacterium]MBU2164402.1 UDP-N-acetylmuramate--alanine ligase [Alphaproteobacteria bacterium]MBU2231510.1 UDP-N-acetylmuramate--alanine ligase [Alphaproteobacteria bacterium]